MGGGITIRLKLRTWRPTPGKLTCLKPRHRGEVAASSFRIPRAESTEGSASFSFSSTSSAEALPGSGAAVPNPYERARRDQPALAGWGFGEFRCHVSFE